MMKSYKASCDKDAFTAVKRLPDGKYAVRWNPQEVTEGEGEEAKVKVIFDEAVTDGKPSYGSIVNLIVRQKYSESAELALARQSYQDVAGYLEYNAYVEQCKKWAKEAVGGEYVPKYAPTQTEIVRSLRLLLSDTIDELPDADAVKVPALFEPWKPEEKMTAGVRRYYDGSVYRCLKTHTSAAGKEPDTATALWAEITEEGA